MDIQNLACIHRRFPDCGACRSDLYGATRNIVIEDLKRIVLECVWLESCVVRHSMAKAVLEASRSARGLWAAGSRQTARLLGCQKLSATKDRATL